MGIVENMQHLERYGGVSRGKFEGHPLENGEGSQVALPKFKRRKVSAVRDFPEGCGRNTPRIHAMPAGAVGSLGGIDENSAGRFKSQAALEANYIQASVTGAESQSLQPLQGSVHAGVLKCSNNLESNVEKPMVEGLGLMNNELEGIGLPMDFDNAGSVDSLYPSKHEVSELPKNSQKTEIATPTEDRNGLKSSSPRSLLIKDENIVGKTLSWNYPPRRKISAIRDFPSLCGRSAPCLRTNLEDKIQKTITAPCVSDVNRPNHSSLTCGKGNDMEVGKEIIVCGGEVGGLDRKKGNDIVVFDMEVLGVEGKVGNEVMLHNKNKSMQKNYPGFSGSKTQFHAENVGLELEMDRTVVQGLMAAPNCPWRQLKGALKPDWAGKQGYSGNKLNFSEQGKPKSILRTKKAKTENFGGQSHKRKSSPKRTAAYREMGQLVIRDEVDSIEHDEEHEDFHVAFRSREFNVSLPPFGQSSSSGKGDDNDAIVTRNKVRETLRIFQVVCRKLLQEEEAKSKQGGNGLGRVDLLAAKVVKNKGKYVNTGKQILGIVPGVEVGDEFHYRVELAIVGLHRPLQAGIDYRKQGAKLIATSVVALASGAYADDLDDSEVLIYMGSGGNLTGGGDKQPEDQKLKQGNLALANSVHAKSPVRVIRGFKEMKASDSSGRAKVVCTYTYDGLYLVDKYWQEPGPHGKLVYQFQLVRIPGQPELAWNEVKRSKKLKIREGMCVNDISQGKELFPICAINTINDENPPQFKYISSMIYPNWCNPIPPRGCGCTYGCSESERCSCAVKNGVEIPYNHNGAIVEVKPLVYECGPSCKCPPSCHNRVSQHGIKFQLEIFKTVSRGWGVRSLNSIPSGSFICEYLGELLDDKEAEQRTGSDEYLFDIGQNYNDQTLCGGPSKPMDPHSGSREVVEEGGFTIDAAQYGNVGRFINHSCSPNLYAQNVLYDHEDRRMPHIMLFAAENIPPLKELTYHYNYTIDQVRDSNGNIKKKRCYCGSAECVGRMY